MEEYATSEYGTTYRVYATFDSPTNELIAVYGTVSEAQDAFECGLYDWFYNTALGSNFGEFINLPFTRYSLKFNTTAGLPSNENTNGDGGVSSVGLEPYLDGFNNGNGLRLTRSWVPPGLWFRGEQ